MTETDSSGLSQLEESLYEEPEGTSAGSSDTGPVDLQDIKMLLLSESNTTPVSGAEGPCSVLSRVQCVEDERADERPLEERPSPAARVCLEKRYMPPDGHIGVCDIEKK